MAESDERPAPSSPSAGSPSASSGVSRDSSRPSTSSSIPGLRPSSPSSTPLPSMRPSGLPSLRTPEQRRARRIFLWVSAMGASLVLIVSAEVLLPFVLGMLVAYILLPAVLRVERKGVPRWAAILLVYAITLGSIGGFIALIVPSILTEAKALKNDLPRQIAEAESKWFPVIDERLAQWLGPSADEPSEPAPAPVGSGSALAPTPPVPAPSSSAALVVVPRPDGSLEVEINPHVQLRQSGDGVWKFERSESEASNVSASSLLARASDRVGQYVAENSVELIRLGQRIVSAISRGVFNLFMTLMLGGYMMLTHEKILGFFKELFTPERQPSFERFVRRLDRGLSGVVRGQLLICLVNGVLSAIGFWLFDLKYWPIMSLIAAVGSLIPIFGSILSTIPAVAIGLTQSPGTAVAVLAWIVGIHQLEANFLNPKIIGDSAKIHPVLVVFSLLVGEHFFQIKGALFAVPCLSIVQTIFLHFREATMGLADPTATQHPELRLATVEPPSGQTESGRPSMDVTKPSG